MARVSKNVQEIKQLLQPEDLAAFVTNKYVTWRSARQSWLTNMKELRNYIFQTDTTQTSNKSLPWKNTTSLPKLCQIRDNLHANYMAALFPHDKWFRWQAANDSAASVDTVRAIEAFMQQKIRESSFKQIISQTLYDYIDGNAFGEVTFDNEIHTLPSGEKITLYNGPRVHRISPFDHYFDLTASSYEQAAKITRTVASIGSLKVAADQDPAFAWVKEALPKLLLLREGLSAYGDSDIDKSEGMEIDGFGSASNYFSSGMVELLEFEGDLYIQETGEILTNHRVIVADRRLVVHKAPIESWFGKSNKIHVGWRLRPDNLMAMGPLDNLVGLQYRLDHLENLKADVFDQIAHPMVYQRGVVEDWEWEPGGRIFGDTESDVSVLRPDATALTADFQIDTIMRNMENLAGAPQQAMGIRTPGEKTAFEIQALENAAGRIFQQKIQYFEEMFIEPMLNQMLEAARRNLTGPEMVPTVDEDFGITEFLSITPQTLNQKGKLYPIGARHFSKQAQVIQNLMGFVNSAAYQDPSVNTHISGKRIAALIEENLGLYEFELVKDNIRVAEMQETQALAAQAQENVAGEIMQRQSTEDQMAAEAGLPPEGMV